MKKDIRILLLTLTMAAFCTDAYAQKSDRQRMTREQLAEVQASFIASKIALDDTATRQFIETFCRFQKDVWALGPRPGNRSSNRSETETETALKKRFTHSQRILDLRKKYYTEYSRFLTQKQIERVYELERQMMKRLKDRRNPRKR